MRATSVVPLLACVSAFAAPLAAQATPVRPAEIAVSAQGEATVTPDRAMVTLGVQSRAATASEAARANAAAQRAVLDTLRAMGFRNEQIATANFNVRPEYVPSPSRGGSPEVSGYVVSNTVQVTLESTARIGEVVDAALAKGANTVYGMNLMVGDPAPARRTAIADAMRKARAEAEALARAAGGSLGRLLEVTTLPAGDPRIMARGGFETAGARVMTPIEPGEARVTAVVSARWELVRGG